MADSDEQKQQEMDPRPSRTLAQHITHALVPHEGNSHLPALLQTRGVLVTAAVIVFLFIGASITQRSIVSGNDFYAAVITSVLVDLTNTDRAANGLGLLTHSPTLAAAAQLKANDMAAKSYFAHTSPEGINPWHWFRQANYSFLYAGENLAVNFSDSSDVERAWMNSPTHRANVLGSQFTEIGIATAKGTYQGRDTIFVVQLFGTPKVAKASTVGERPTTIIGTTTAPVITPAPVTTAPQPQPVAVRGESTTTAPTTEEVIMEDDTFIAVRDAEALPAASVGQSETVSPFLAMVRQFFTSPGTILNWAYVALAALLALVLILTIVIEVRLQHSANLALGGALIGLMALGLFAFKSLDASMLLIL